MRRRGAAIGVESAPAAATEGSVGAPVNGRILGVTLKDWLEIGSYAVTIVALPFAVAVFLFEQRKARANEEEEQYQHLSDAYNRFLGVVLDNADLQLRSEPALPDPTPEQRERMLVIFDMLVSLFERAYLVAYRDDMGADEQRRWNSWEDYMREWCRREDFRNLLPQLLSGEDPAFSAYIERLAREERATQR
jgi:hypothetical protein